MGNYISSITANNITVYDEERFTNIFVLDEKSYVLWNDN